MCLIRAGIATRAWVVDLIDHIRIGTFCVNTRWHHVRKKSASRREHVGNWDAKLGTRALENYVVDWYISHSLWINVSPILRRCIKNRLTPPPPCRLKIAVVDVLECHANVPPCTVNCVASITVVHDCGVTYTYFFFFSLTPADWHSTHDVYVDITHANAQSLRCDKISIDRSCYPS